MSDYSQYVAVKKISVAQKANANTSITKGRAPNMYDGYFPLYRGIGLPPNALISNKFLSGTTSAAAVNAFTLSDIAGLAFWVDASDTSSVTLSGSNVSQWNDKSTNAYNLTQDDNGRRPTFANNLVTFVNNRHLNIPQRALNNGTNYAIFLVINPLTFLNYIFVKQINGSDTQNGLMMTNYPDGGRAEGTTGYLYWRTSNSRTLGSSNTALSTSTLQILGLVVSSTGTVLSIYRNGTLITPSTSGNYTITDTTTASNFTLGAWIADNVYQDDNVTHFRLGEMAFYNPVSLSTTQRQQIEGYLAWKWSLQNSLPSDHPYKNTRP